MLHLQPGCQACADTDAVARGIGRVCCAGPDGVLGNGDDLACTEQNDLNKVHWCNTPTQQEEEEEEDEEEEEEEEEEEGEEEEEEEVEEEMNDALSQGGTPSEGRSGGGRSKRGRCAAGPGACECTHAHAHASA